MDKVHLISKMTQGLFNQTDVAQLVSIVMKQACDLLDADRATLFVVRTVATKTKVKVKRELYTFAADGTDPIAVPIDAGLVGACVSQGALLNVADAYNDKRFNRDIDRKSGYRTKQVLCAPIVSEDTKTDGDGICITGVLQVLNRTQLQDRGFSLHDEELITGFTQQIAIALDSIIKTQRENDVKVGRFLFKYQNVCVARAWNTWEALYNEAKRHRYLQTRAMKFWYCQKYARAWTPWVYLVQTRKRQRELMNRVLRRMEKVKLHSGFQSWIRHSHYVQAHKDMQVTIEDLRRERAHHREQIMKRAIRHMRFASMSRCFNQWQADVDAAVHRRVIVARAAGRFRRRLVGKAFASMEEHAATRIYQRNVVLRVLHKVDNFALHKSFSKMLSVIADARAVQLQKEQLLLEMSNGMASAKDLEQLIILTMHQVSVSILVLFACN
jgi:hypothetical protein